MPEVIDKLRLEALWRDGCTVREISRQTGWKIDSIYKRAHAMGLPKRKPGINCFLDRDPEKRRWFIRNYPEMSNSTISVYLGISPDHIGKVARQLGLKKSEAYWEGIREYHKKRVREYHDSQRVKMEDSTSISSN